MALRHKMKTEKGQRTKTHQRLNINEASEKRGPDPSRWDSRSSTIDKANGQGKHRRIQTIIFTEMNHVHLRTRQQYDNFRTQTNSDLPCNNQKKRQ